MINIRDIQARYSKWPEPREVTEARERITKAFEDLKFIEESHQYFVEDREYPPVSTVCHKFEPYVDWDQIAATKAKKLGKLRRHYRKSGIKIISPVHHVVVRLIGLVNR